MKLSVTVTEVLRNFADYINRVAYRGERFILLRGGKPVAELSPLPVGTRLADLPSLLDGLPRLSAEEAERFSRDLEEARVAMGVLPPGGPWES
jgi:antitoxin (DNA-binding transcriptional repressor) of toxin-antitoxin stability system